ncbi:MAG: hypothetical protein K2N79_04980 [Muribaculaceae bacterium]|nr:hypothetical protein [Muribaculaceae bacterium]MDE7369755.1 hypothetical protein [Muribaculaceae bacterium]
MNFSPKHKAVLSRIVINCGEIKQLSVVKRNDNQDCHHKYIIKPFDMETESTVFVDSPIALLNKEMNEQFTQSSDVNTLIKKAQQLSSTITNPDSIFLLSPGKISILDI